MNAIQKITCASLVIASLGGGALAWAAEVGRDFALGVNEANAKLRDGDVDGALAQYADVRTLAPESADLSYNMAVAQYRKGDVAAAETLFQSAATSENDTLAGKARYNLGNCNYASGLELSQKDRPAAIQQLESAIDNYRSSLAVDSSNADARANIELASRLIDKLREEEKQEQQQNQQNQQQDQQQQSSDQQQNNQQQNSQDQQRNEDQKKQDQENQDQQQQDQEQNNEQKNDQKQSQQQDSQSSQSNEQQDQQQESGSEQQQEKQDQHEQDGEQSNQPEQKDEQAQQNQSQSARPPNDQQQQSQPSQPRPQESQPNDTSAPEESKEDQGQQPPQGELTATTEEEAKDNKEKNPIAIFDPSKDGEMTQQEAEKMLQAIRDRDMLRRYRRQQDELQRHVPVDRDW